MGQVIQAGAKMNAARQAAVRSGLPVTVPPLTAGTAGAICIERSRRVTAGESRTVNLTISHSQKDHSSEIVLK